MPELPEVETVRRQLDERLAGAKIFDVHIRRTGRERPAGNKFKQSLNGKTIQRVQRRAKLLIWKFTDGTAMIVHLKMTGKCMFVGKDYQPSTHDRILFVFDTDERLVWNDVRQFGFVQYVAADELETILLKYGPEPLESSIEEIAARFEKPKTRPIKAALLNQEVIAGVGNIYADEVCFRAGIKPMRKLGSLRQEDRLRLARELKVLLTEAVAQRGTSANDYVDTEGEKGGFLSLLRVYGRSGLPCVTCNQKIKKIVFLQRGTHYCEKCQKS